MAAKILPTSSAVCGARCAICNGLANPPKGSSLVTPFGKFWIAFWKFGNALEAESDVRVA